MASTRPVPVIGRARIAGLLGPVVMGLAACQGGDPVYICGVTISDTQGLAAFGVFADGTTVGVAEEAGGVAVTRYGDEMGVDFAAFWRLAEPTMRGAANSPLMQCGEQVISGVAVYFDDGRVEMLETSCPGNALDTLATTLVTAEGHAERSGSGTTERREGALASVQAACEAMR